MNEQLPTNLTLTIRLATASDARRLAELRYLFRAALNPVNETEDSFVERCSHWMHVRLQDNNHWRCWVAEGEATIIGALWLQLIEKIPNPIAEPEYHAYVTNFYVREDARGLGLGTTLLQAALAWSHAQQVQTVILWPTAQSRSLYLRHGFAVSDEIIALAMTAWH